MRCGSPRQIFCWLLCAHIVIPLPWTPVPITGQTFGVLLVAVLLGARRGAITLYFVFARGRGGVAGVSTAGVAGIGAFCWADGWIFIVVSVCCVRDGWLVERGAKSGMPATAAFVASRVCH